MRRIRIEESAAVCAQFLDYLLRRDRRLSDSLIGHRLSGLLPGIRVCLGDLLGFDQRHLSIRLEVLNHSLRYQCERSDYAKRKQHVERTPGQINPEVSDSLRLTA